jgi:hypothetical protein
MCTVQQHSWARKLSTNFQASQVPASFTFSVNSFVQTVQFCTEVNFHNQLSRDGRVFYLVWSKWETWMANTTRCNSQQFIAVAVPVQVQIGDVGGDALRKL